MPSIIAIAEETFSKGYFERKPDELLLVLETEGKIRGFLCGSVITSEAILRTICVTGSSRGKGFAHRLGDAFLNQTGGRPISSPAWIRQDGAVPAEGLLQGLGLERAEVRTNYWREETIRRHLSCPDCGPPACHCSAQMFRSKSAPTAP
jgi:hypothetical protein